MSLASDQYFISDTFWIPRPELSNERLLLLEGNQQQVEKLSKAGFQVSTLSENPAFWSEVDFKNFETCDWAVIDSIHFGYAPDYTELKEIVTKIPNIDNYRLFVDLCNKEYFQSKLNRVTREINPWVQHRPHGFSYNISEVEPFFSNSINFVDHLDKHYHLEGSNSWSHINGVDCKVFLSNDPIQRKLEFQQSLRFEVRENYRVKSNQLSDDIFTQMDNLFSVGDLNQVVQILEQNKDQAGEWKYDNSLALLAFYKQEYLDSYLHLLNAVEKAPNEIDLYRNLYDVSEKIGREKDVIHLVSVQKENFSNLKELDFAN